MKKAIATLFVLLLLPLSLSGCKADETPATGDLYTMSTYVTQQVYGREKEKAIENVNTLLKSLDKKLSLFQEGSDIDRINQNAGISPVKVDDYTFALISAAKRYGEDSKGLFDITIAPITLLWGIDTDQARVPSQEEIASALPLVDSNQLILNEKEKTVFLQEKGMKIDLGGIAKGYMAAAIYEEYQKLDITAALVSIGGNICAYGTKPNGEAFTLGIRDPASKSSAAIMGKLQVTDKVLATTGAYERYFEQDGKIYHHILDPKTGYPVQSDLLSVTVISEDGGLADFLSTTLYMAGSENIEKYRNNSRFSVIVIDKENKVYISDSLKGNFELLGEGYTLAGDE